MSGNYKLANSSYDDLIDVIRDLRSEGVAGEHVLLELMNDFSISVASWAAIHSLTFAESTALEVLDKLAQRDGILAFNAGVIARQWRSGCLIIE